MKLEIFYESKINFIVNFDNQVFYLSCNQNYVVIEYVPIIGKIYTIEIISNDEEIIKKPIIINKIIFDDFWIFQNKKLAFGENIYSKSYLDFAKKNNIAIDLNVTDNTVMFFTGKLIFRFIHPIYKFYEKKTLY